MAYNIATISGIKKHFPQDLFKLSKPYFEKMQEGSFFCDDSNIKQGKIHTVKISSDNFIKISPILKKTKVKPVMKAGKKQADVLLSSKYTLRFLETGKVSVRASDAQSTAKQERASLRIIERGLRENKNYTNIGQITKDVKFYNELVEIYPELNDTWLKGLFAQHKKMNQLYRGAKFDVYNRDGGFMDYISNIVKEKFKISKKDSWCPADIWLIKNEKNVRKLIDKSVSEKSPSISRLNDTMRTLYEKKLLVGVSLKAISGINARYENVNTQKSSLKNSINFKLDNIKIKFSLKSDNTFSSSDTVITIKQKEDGAKFQLRQNSKGFNNLKFEPTKIGAGAARLGKVPLDMLSSLLKDYSISEKEFVNNWRVYPQSATEFKKVQYEYKKKFEFIKNKSDTEISSSNFINNVIKSFNSPDLKNGVTTSKLQQLDFVHSILKLSEKKRNELLTEMLYLSEKKGPNFAPFGKLY